MDLPLFEDELVLRGLEPETISDYLQKMRQIEKHCPSLNEQTFKYFLVKQKKAGKKGSSINKLINVLRQYARITKIDWPLTIAFLDEEEPNKEIYSDEEIEHIIHCERPHYCDKAVWARWSMWYSILAFSGMRPSEAASLTVSQVDWGTNNFILRKTKTTPRRVPIAENIKEDLKKYMADKSTYLFPIGSGHITQRGWYKHHEIRKKISGISRPGLTPHSFRHTFITNLQEEKVPLQDVMNMVGHKDPRTTLAYSHLGNKSAQQSINQHSLVKKQAKAEVQLESFIEEARRRGILNSDKFTWKITDTSILIEIKETV